jgi:hypothetical protein
MRETANDAYVGAGLPGKMGETPGRALCLIDRLHRSGAITTEMWMAGNELRQMIMAEMPPSEGVSPVYDPSSRPSEPSRKADRRGRRLTGFEVDHDGTVSYKGDRRNRANLRELEDALFAACGLHDTRHNRVADTKHVEILMRVVLESENMPTLLKLGCELTPWVMIKDGKDKGKMEPFYGDKSKQTPPFANGHISVWLGRLALHLGMTK